MLNHQTMMFVMLTKQESHEAQSQEQSLHVESTHHDAHNAWVLYHLNPTIKLAFKKRRTFIFGT